MRPLPRKRSQERAVAERREDARRDAAAQVDAARRHDRERQVRPPRSRRARRTGRASRPPGDSCPRAPRRVIAAPGSPVADLLRQPRGLLAAAGVAQELVERREARPGDDALPAHVPGEALPGASAAARSPPASSGRSWRARPRSRTADAAARPSTVRPRRARFRRRSRRRCPVAPGAPGSSSASSLGGERAESPGGGLQVVDHPRARADLAAEVGGVDDPRQVRRDRAAVVHRSCDAEAGGRDAARRCRRGSGARSPPGPRARGSGTCGPADRPRAVRRRRRARDGCACRRCRRRGSSLPTARARRVRRVRSAPPRPRVPRCRRRSSGSRRAWRPTPRGWAWRCARPRRPCRHGGTTWRRRSCSRRAASRSRCCLLSPSRSL